MKSTITDVIIHTRETLNKHQFDEVSRAIHLNDGIVSFNRNTKTPHCLMVVYNTAEIQSISILKKVTGMGIRASLVGI